MEETDLIKKLVEHRKALNTFRMLVEVLPEDENLVEAKRIFIEQVNHSNQTFRFAMNDINEFVQERDKTQADREELFNARVNGKVKRLVAEYIEQYAEDEKEANDLLIAKAEKEKQGREITMISDRTPGVRGFDEAADRLDDKFAVLLEFKMTQLKEMALGVGMEPKAINKLRSKKALATEVAKRQ